MLGLPKLQASRLKFSRPEADEEKKMTEKKVVKKKITDEAPKKKAPKVKKAETAVSSHKAQEATYTKKEPKVSALPKSGVFEGTGRRKTATAHVYIFKGTGKINVNSKPYTDYFVNRAVSLAIVLKSLRALNVENTYDIEAKVLGGGVPAQADAIRMGIARALVAADPKNRLVLRSLDLLMRDPRVKERKKYGLKRARRAFQFSKR